MENFAICSEIELLSIDGGFDPFGLWNGISNCGLGTAQVVGGIGAASAAPGAGYIVGGWAIYNGTKTYINGIKTIVKSI